MGKPIFWLLGASLLLNAFLLGVNFQSVSETGETFAKNIIGRIKAAQSEQSLQELDRQIADARKIPKGFELICHHPLTNAMLLHSAQQRYNQVSSSACASSKLGHSIEIKNGSNAHAIVKIRGLFDTQAYISLLVLKGGIVRESCIPDGPYKVQFGFGQDLNEQCKSFVKLHGTQEFKEIIDLKTRRTNRGTSWEQISFTLYPVPDGNAQTQGIAEASFTAD